MEKQNIKSSTCIRKDFLIEYFFCYGRNFQTSIKKMIKHEITFLLKREIFGDFGSLSSYERYLQAGHKTSSQQLFFTWLVEIHWTSCN